MAFNEAQEKRHSVASFYSNKFNGRKTASGEIFSQTKYTCATNMYPLGTVLRVTNPVNDSTVDVVVNDRTHVRFSERIDLSRIAMQKLEGLKKGILNVLIEKL